MKEKGFLSSFADKLGRKTKAITLGVGLLSSEAAMAEEPGPEAKTEETAKESSAVTQEVLGTLHTIVERVRSRGQRYETARAEAIKVFEEIERLQKKKHRSAVDETHLTTLKLKYDESQEKSKKIMLESDEDGPAVREILKKRAAWSSDENAAKEIYLTVAEIGGSYILQNEDVVEEIRLKPFAADVFMRSVKGYSPQSRMENIASMYFDLSDTQIPDWAKKEAAADMVMVDEEGMTEENKNAAPANWIIGMTKMTLRKIGPEMATQVRAEHPRVDAIAKMTATKK